MTSRRTSQAAAAAPLVYWLLVMGGLLAAHRVVEHQQSASAGIALWLGAVMGTLIGQGLAYKRVRLWMVVGIVPFVLMTSVWAACVLGGAGTEVLSEKALGVALMALVPAIFCGWASMSERGALVAFWFPASIWMVAILDGAQVGVLSGLEGWALLSGLVGLFVAMLYAREARRVALWQAHADVRLSVVHPPNLLRSLPSASARQAAWVTSTACAMLALTAWIAPHLWQADVEKKAEIEPSFASMSATDPISGVKCCPGPAKATVESQKLREYLPLIESQDSVMDVEEPAACVVCQPGGPVAATEATTFEAAYGPAAHPHEPTVYPSTAHTAAGTSTTTTAIALGPTVPTTTPMAWATAETITVTSLPPTGLYAPVGGHAPAIAEVEPTYGMRFTMPPVTWLFGAALLALLAPIAMRPLRRAVHVRHLSAPFWTESVEQRVSNLWQLVLVGLRDAGWHSVPGEDPASLARRAAVPDAEACAQVLERTRHGVRLDAGDLVVMQGAAENAYHASRAKLGLVARILSWLRWPLV